MAYKPNRRITLPFGLSLTIHAVLLGALVWFGLSTFKPPAGDDSSGGASGSAAPETSIQEDVDKAVGEIAERIDTGLAAASARSESENLERLEEGVAWVESHSSEESIESIGAVVRGVYGTNDRAYKPVYPRPKGSFHTRSMLEFTRETRVDDDGIQRSHRTFVDKDGRTMVQTYRTMRDDNGKLWMMVGMYQPDGTLYESKMPHDPSLAARDQALDRMSKSPLLKKLLSEAVLPVLEAKQREQEKGATPGRRSEPSSTPKTPDVPR